MYKICKNCAYYKEKHFVNGEERGYTEYRCWAAGDQWIETEPFGTCDNFEEKEE